jgi:hypothetical protein
MISELFALPAQFYPTRTTTPEQRLLLAMLELCEHDMHSSTRRQDAYQYLTSPSTGWGSFLYCCEHLRLDPHQTRKRMLITKAPASTFHIRQSGPHKATVHLTIHGPDSQMHSYCLVSHRDAMRQLPHLLAQCGLIGIVYGRVGSVTRKVIIPTQN